MRDDEAQMLLAVLLRTASRATLQALMASSGLMALAKEPGKFHHGDDPIVADLEAQAAFEQAAQSHYGYRVLRIAAIRGEERPDGLPQLQIGERVIVVDPLDGSKPWALVRMGFCVAAICLRWDGAGWVIDGAVVATPTDVFTLVGTHELRYGPLDGDPANDVSLASVLPEDPRLGARSLSAVAYKPEDRDLVQSMLERLPRWSFISLGGNPTIPRVVSSGLTAAMTIKSSSVWDSIGILMAAATDATIGDHAGNVVSGADLRGLFAQVLLTGNVTPIPKLIVCKNANAYEELVRAVS